ncbi:DsbA family protein [Lactobacillus sp. LL6]|uniref:DsbA family protein n=1 Tax=Lactobacillus sp. LL6 TaxID=2596827 RepID=UPI001184C369|nr:DsbA family protein [Lactobacillus sp. LL6]TSO25990.1 DsbA family protein [Lactobacillus sp. LL6]
MFEFFLFINPIGIYCYDIEKQIQDAINELGVEACYHFIPITSMNVIQDDIMRRRKDAQKVIDITRYTIATNRALQDYHAIKLAYGNKKARKFIFALQQKLSNDCSLYCADMPTIVAKEIGLNPKNINAAKNGNYIDDSIKQDLKLAEQWNVVSTPTTVIFNEDEEGSGMLLEGSLDYKELIDLLSSKPERKTLFPDIFADKHLRLV